MKGLIAMAGMLASLGAVISISAAQAVMPTGIAIRLAYEGPVFVDGQGMTLYKVNKKGGPESCNTRHEAVLLQDSLEGRVDFSVTAPDIKTRRTCLEKHPPLSAPPDAKPIGHWTVHLREDGSSQWAYDGEPLYTSIKDKWAGDVNGAGADLFGYTHYTWLVARAPLVGAPPNISTSKTALGLALASETGRALYYPERSDAAVDSGLWQPVAAPELATAQEFPDWSIVTRRDGLRQWTYKGRPLYTYIPDSDSAGEQYFRDVFGGVYGHPIRGWRVALLKEAPAHPGEVTIHKIEDGFSEQHDIEKMVYATVQGMTLYTIHCVEDTADKLDCDDVGDSSRYWVSFCGSEDRCAKTWQPLSAPVGAKSIGNIWSVITINPHHPWRAIAKDMQGLSVWAYRGRPVFTYAQDLRPGDYYASHAQPPQEMYAQYLLAFDTDHSR